MRIASFIEDKIVTIKDLLLGTDGDNLQKTKNFRISSIVNLILGQVQNAGVTFQFSQDINFNSLDVKEGFFYAQKSGLLPTDSKSETVSIYVHQTTMFGENVAELFTSAGGFVDDLYLSLTQQDDNSNFTFFNLLSVKAIDNYIKIDVSLRRNLYSKVFVPNKNFNFLFDFASSEYNIRKEGSHLILYKNGKIQEKINLSLFIDDINISVLESGTVDALGNVTFTRTNGSNFVLDLSTFLGRLIPVKTSDIINDGDGVSPFVTRDNTYYRTEIDSKDSFLAAKIKVNTDSIADLETDLGLTNDEIGILKGLSISIDAQESNLLLKDGDNQVFSTLDISSFKNSEIINNLDSTSADKSLSARQGKVLQGLIASKVDDKNYVHDQGLPSEVWTVAHNLDKYPSVSAVDTAKTVVVGKTEYIDSNNLTLTFNASFSGQAYIN